MILCQGETIPVACLPAELQQLGGGAPAPPPIPAAEEAPEEVPEVSRSPASLATLEELEQRYIREVLASVSGNRSQAARVLGISRSTLQDKIRRYGLT
jgi:DNA-binding NtrC family response regulator